MNVCKKRGYHKWYVETSLTDNYEELEIIVKCEDCNKEAYLTGDWE